MKAFQTEAMDPFPSEAMDPFPFDDESNRWVLGYDNSPEVVARWVQLQEKMHAEFMASLQQ